MSSRNIREALAAHPIIAAVHSFEDAAIAAESPCAVVFLLGGKLFDIKQMTERLRQRGKTVFVHLDLAEGIARDANGVQILAEIVRPDGVITTKNNLVRVIREYGMLAALRCFIMDGQSYHKAVQVSGNASPDFIELMPGILPQSLIAEFCRETGAQRRGRQSGLCRRRTGNFDLRSLPLDASNWRGQWNPRRDLKGSRRYGKEDFEPGPSWLFGLLSREYPRGV